MAGRVDPATGLQEQMMRFAEEYLVDFNASAAYQRAGYKTRGAAAQAAASRLLANPKVQAYLAGRKEALVSAVRVDQEAVLARIAHMALGDIRRLFDSEGNLKAMHDLTAEEAALLQGVEVFEEFEGRGDARTFVGLTKKVRFVNRLDAAKTLGQHFGLFAKKVEHSGPGGGPIQQQHGVLGELLEMVDGAETGIGPARSRKQ